MEVFSFSVKFGIDIVRPVPACYKSIRKDNRLLATYYNLHPEPKVFQRNGRLLIMLGSPIYRDKVDVEKVSALLLTKDLSKELLSTINGSFLFIMYSVDNEKPQITIINDRFASIPFYYRVDGNLFSGAISYVDIWDSSRSIQDFIGDINQEAFLEFLHLKQLLGDKTYDLKTKYLEPASVLKYSEKDLSCDTYWEPRYNCEDISFEEFTWRFLELFKRSLKRKYVDTKKYGLFLSGGLDSRLILAALESPVISFTIGDFFNTEVKVARKVTQIKKCSHIFLQRDIDFYHTIVPPAVAIGGGMYSFENAHFMNYSKLKDYGIDVMWHGCFLDSLFQGNYLPKKPRVIGRFPTSFYRILDIKNSLIEGYLSSIKYRLRSVNPLFLIKEARKKDLSEALHQSVNNIIEEGRAYCNDEYEIWDYLSFHNISRYWSFLNVLSMRVDFEEYTPALDNDLFNLYFTMPLEFKLYARVPKKALSILNPRMANTVNANSGNRIVNSPLMDTIANVKHKTASKLFNFLRKNRNQHTIFTQRSWLNYDEYIRQIPPMRRLVEGLKDSELLESIGIFDMDKVRELIDSHLNNKNNHSDAILRLLTIEQLLLMIAHPFEIESIQRK